MSFDTSKPIDFVMIWVDGNDPEWRAEKAKYDGRVVTASNSEVRYRDWDNLQYWFRAVEKYAPWVNKIHFVTWGHLPPWLDTSNPKLNIVKHTDYIPEEYLPTFSSHTIELNLHRIEGLAEQFVYFNDDTFLTAPVTPEDFFKNGKPCDTVAQDCIFFGKDSAGSFNGADITVINSHFRKKAVIKKDLRKWLNLKNSFRNVVKTILLYPWPWFPGLFYQHASNSFLKSTFETVWEKEFEALDETCSHRFRKSGDLNQWVMKFWQQAEGNFEVRSEKFAYCYHVKESNFGALCRDIPSGKHSMLCINDTAKTRNFEDKKQKLNEVFEECFPEISSFESAEYYSNLSNKSEPVQEVDPEEEKLRQQRFALLDAISYFSGVVEFAQNSKTKKLSSSRQLFVLSQLESLIRVSTPLDKLLSSQESSEFLSGLKKVVNLIDDEAIVKSSIQSSYKLFITQLKRGAAPEVSFDADDAFLGYSEENRYSLGESTIYLNGMRICDNTLYIDGNYPVYTALPKNVEITVYANGKQALCKCEEIENGLYAVGKRVQRKIGFHAEVPLFSKKGMSVNFKLKFAETQIDLKSLDFGRGVALSRNIMRTYYYSEGWNITTDGSELRAKKSGIFGRLCCELKFQAQIIRRNRRGGLKAVAVRSCIPIMRLFSLKPIYIVEGPARELSENTVGFYRIAKEFLADAKVMLVVPEGYKNDGTLSQDDAVLEKETRNYKRTLLLSRAVYVEYPPETFYNPFRKRYGYYKDILSKKPVISFYGQPEGIDAENFYSAVLKGERSQLNAADGVLNENEDE